MVLEPVLGFLDLTSGLRGKRMYDLDIAVLENLFPFKGGIFGEEGVFISERVLFPGQI